MISFWNLALRPEDAAEYDSNFIVVRLWRAWDVLATILGICCNLVTLSFLVREEILRWSSMAIISTALMLQTIKLTALRQGNDAHYVLYRYWICLANRAIRFMI
jgi:hypothetical protein